MDMSSFGTVVPRWMGRPVGLPSQIPELAMSSITPVAGLDDLKKLTGRWELLSIKDEAGNIIGTNGIMSLDILPKRVPRWASRVPLVRGAIHRGAKKGVSRTMEDIQVLVPQIKDELAAGKTIEEILGEILANLPIDTDDWYRCLANLPIDTDDWYRGLANLPIDTDDWYRGLANLPIDTDDWYRGLANLPIDTDDW
eukprot:gene18167-24599_t